MTYHQLLVVVHEPSRIRITPQATGARIDGSGRLPPLPGGCPPTFAEGAFIFWAKQPLAARVESGKASATLKLNKDPWPDPPPTRPGVLATLSDAEWKELLHDLPMRVPEPGKKAVKK